MAALQDIKNRFGIIGNSPLINRAIEIASQVAPTTMSVLIQGESGSGKEVFSQIIHTLSSRKHGPFIAVNCGAIPEGTIDSELFGHEKGSFTGAVDARKGYFEVVNGGTIFLDEVGELPLGTQARLLRVLESGEFIRVGSSKVQKTDVRVVAATNVQMIDAVHNSKFREDLYYRLNTVPLRIPALRERREDIYLLFRKFVSDFTAKYNSPPLQLTAEAQQILANYSWPGNVRQLKNIAEQMCVLQEERMVGPDDIQQYLPEITTKRSLPALMGNAGNNDSLSEREILYKVLFDLKKDMADMKTVVATLMHGTDQTHMGNVGTQWFANEGFGATPAAAQHYFEHSDNAHIQLNNPSGYPKNDFQKETIEVEEALSLGDREKELIIKALKKHRNKRKPAALELGISERTLYRKIKEYGLE